MPKLDLNVFTNFCTDTVEHLPILKTLRSFGTAFGFGAFANIRVFCHAAPLSISFADLHAALRTAIPGRTIELHSTRGLADGYVQSVRLSDADLLFQLEHDYEFDAGLVGHDIVEIAQAMRTDGLPYMRFNIGPNVDNELDRITPVDVAGIPACKTVIFSNRPHLLDRAHALQSYIPRINLAARGSRGIEKELTEAFHAGWIYGPPGHPAVIRHIDGYNQLRDWRRQSLARRLREFVSRHGKTAREHFAGGRYGRIY